MIKFAIDSGQANLLIPILRGKVDKLLAKWTNAPQSIRDIYFLFSALFRMQSGKINELLYLIIYS